MSSISPTPCRRTLTQTTRIVPDGSLYRLGHGVAICGGSIPPLIIFNNFHHPQTPMHILMATTCGASSAGLPRCRRSLGTSYSPSRTIRLSTPTILAKRLKSPAPPSRGQALHLLFRERTPHFGGALPGRDVRSQHRRRSDHPQGPL